ncbi:hypothetical protein RJ639_045651, partial [Escallonia herrerae]
SLASVFTLTQDGFTQQRVWNSRTKEWLLYESTPVDNCDDYALCGPYSSCNIGNSPLCSCLDEFVPKYQSVWDVADWSNGCVRKMPLSCSNGVGFRKYSAIKLPDTRTSWFDETMTLNECEKVCLKNCSCTAYANLDIRGGGSGCLLWFGDLVDIKEFPEGAQQVYVRIAASKLGPSLAPDNFSGPQGDTRKKRIIIKASLSSLAGIVLLGAGVAVCFQAKKKILQLKREGKLVRLSPLWQRKMPLQGIIMLKQVLSLKSTRSLFCREAATRLQKFNRSGYMSPEYAVDGLFSVSSDVFSFGVLVLEIVSGKKNRCFIHPDHHHNLLGHAWRLHKEDTSMELIDPHIRDSCLASEVLRSIHVGLLCVQQGPKERPSMSSVVLMLASDSTLPLPKHPGFFTERNIESQSSPGMLAPGSVNQVSLTQLSAR